MIDKLEELRQLIQQNELKKARDLIYSISLEYQEECTDDDKGTI